MSVRKRFSDWFEELEPLYVVTYGMTRKEYWYGRPCMAKHYREHYKRTLEDKNEELWRQGLYFLDALNVALYNNINLSGKARQPRQYMKDPIRLFPLEKREAEVEKQRDEIVDNLDKWRKAMGAKYGNRNSSS